MNKNNAGFFIKGQAPGKPTGCEDHFDHLVWSSRWRFFFIKKFCSNSFVHLWKPVALILKMLSNETPDNGADFYI